MKNKKLAVVSREIILFFFVFTSLFHIHEVHALDTESVFKFANSLLAPSSSSSTAVVLSEEELANITKPAVVRIINHVYGTTTLVLDFKIDILNQKIIPTTPEKGDPVPFDLYFSGSGFIITPDGNIVTNSHVISKEIGILDEGARILASTLALSVASKMTEKELNKFYEISTTKEGSKKFIEFGDEIRKRIKEKSILEIHNSVTVLDSLSSKVFEEENISKKESSLEKVKKFVDNGFPAKIVSINEDYKNDNRDVAIIKIEKSNLPSIPFISVKKDPVLSVGQRIFTFGFPANADILDKIGNNYLESTFTSGMVNSFKDSTKKDFKIIQTDAKISSGSSGSPVINQNGEIVGIMDMTTSKDSQSSGDSFAFALPLDPIEKMLQTAKIEPEKGNLYKHFVQGNQYVSEKHCSLALKEFSLAQDIDKDFYTVDFISPYIEKCKKMQADKISIDSEFDQFKIFIKPWKNILLISVSLLFILIIIITVFVRRIKKDEDKMNEMLKNSETKNIEQAPLNVAPNQNQSAQPQLSDITNEQLLRINFIVSYIKEQSVLPGTTSESTVLGLRSMGYSDGEITNGFSILNTK